MAGTVEDRITELLPRAREILARKGTFHPGWDAVFELEALMDGKKTLMTYGDPAVAKANGLIWLAEFIEGN